MTKLTEDDFPLDPIIKQAIETMENAACWNRGNEYWFCMCGRCRTLMALKEIYVA
jgi:hypothetical protein